MCPESKDTSHVGQ